MNHLQTELARVIQDVFNVGLTPELTRPDEQFGDYATNVALQLAGRLQQSPREVATTIADKLAERLGEQVKAITIAGPGFINITLPDNLLLAEVTAWNQRRVLRDGQTVVIETNNPNPFKDLHIGHAYNSIVADTIANLLEASGAATHRVSYHGDVGLHVGKSMWFILQKVTAEGFEALETIPESDRAAFMSEAYRQGVAAYDDDATAHARIDALATQSFALDDPEFVKAYELCKSWSFEYLNATIARIGSKPAEKRYLERDADALGRQVVEAHIGDVFEKSDGAIILPKEKTGLHTRVFINSRGVTLYEARDLGLIQLKDRDFHPDASYIATAEEQRDYFNVVFKAAELVLPHLAGKTINISHGTVKLSTGKMSSRTGQVINIDWLFDELEKAITARGGQPDTLAATIIGALRYTMLKVSIGGDIIFDVSDAISLEGNSGPYLQYAHARARSILAKAEAQPAHVPDDLQPAERSLARHISEYADVVNKATEDLTPHSICTYLYELSQTFNRFYEHNRVLGDARQAERLYLVNLYANVLRDGLQLLSIPAPDHL